MLIPNRFRGKTVLVTASGSGIGRAIAIRFAQEGANLVVVDINEKATNKVAKEIQSSNDKVLAITADATQLDDVERSVRTSLDKFKKIDILVNNAGRFVVRPILETNESDWDPMMNINAKSTFLWSKAVAKSMIEKKSGCIVNISSGSGKVGDPISGLYTLGKHAVIGLTKNLALELAPYGIRVNAVCPGDVGDTPMAVDFHRDLAARAGKSEEQLLKERLAYIPLGRVIMPEDIAGVVTFLASEDAGAMTGQSINVTGGWLMQ